MDEVTTNPAELPQLQTEQAVGAEVETEQTDSEATEGEAPQQDDDSEEFEYEGLKAKLPKPLAEALRKGTLLHADYTKKTQAAAEERRALEARKSEIDQHATAQREYIADLAKLHGVDEQLQAYQKVDWDRLYAEDRDQGDTHWRRFSMLKDQRATLAYQVSEKEQKRQSDAQQATAKRYEEAAAILARDVPGWGKQLLERIEEYGTNQGYSRSDLVERAADPRDVKILNKARLYDELIAKQQKAQKPLPEKQTAPVSTLTTGRAPAAKDPDKMSWADYKAHELKRLARKAG
jgi:hypothetical protein